VKGIKTAPVFLHLPFSNFFEKKICFPIADFVEAFSLGLEAFKNKKRLGYVIFISVVIWTAQAFSYYIIAKGCPEITVNFVQIYFVMIITCFAVALPSVPGFWGVWEAGSVFGLTIFMVPYKQALAYTIVNHVVQIVPVLILGFFSLIFWGRNIKLGVDKKQCHSLK
jgi:hypothetical protein